MTVTFEKSLDINVDSYTIGYDCDFDGDSCTNIQNVTEGQAIQISSSNFAVRTVVVVAVTKDSIESTATTCTYEFAPTTRPTIAGETLEPSTAPTMSPTPDRPQSCLALVTDAGAGEMTITFEKSLDPNIYSYTIGYDCDYYGDSCIKIENILEAEATQIQSYSDFATKSVFVAAVDGSSIESIATTCAYDFAPTRRPTISGETWEPSIAPTISPIIPTTAQPTTTNPSSSPSHQSRTPTNLPTPVPIPTPSTSPTESPTFAGCKINLLLDLIFILESSGSVYDDGYVTWHAEIDFAKAIVNSSLPEDSRVGLINFSGCGSSFTVEQCKQQGRLDKMWTLNSYGNPNDQQAVYDRIDQIDSNDFKGGWSWTDEALNIALNEFNANSTRHRTKMIIIMTHGEPEPLNSGHDPCKASTGYISPTLLSLKQLGVIILAVGIDVTQFAIDDFFKCIVDDFDEHFFYLNEFNQAGDLISIVGSVVCNDDIELIINEVALISNYTNGQDLFFIELYNPSVGTELEGFRFEGMINYTITDSSQAIGQGEYWVISTYDMNSINQTECGNCSQDLLIDSSYADSTGYNNMYWRVDLYNAANELIDSVEKNPLFFPSVRDGYTHELQWEYYDNTLGGNWEESCYPYGTPQEPNQQSCPCNSDHCTQKGDTNAYCGSYDINGIAYSSCVCSDGYILSGRVCVPVFEPECCYAWRVDCAQGMILLDWCVPATSAVSVAAYRIYKDGEIFLSVASSVTGLKITVNDSLDDTHLTQGKVDYASDCGPGCYSVQTKEQSCDPTAANYSVTAIYQSAPLIESLPQHCSIEDPTPSPTISPTSNLADSTSSPTNAPTTAAQTTSDPTSASPTFSEPTSAQPTTSTLTISSSTVQEPITSTLPMDSTESSLGSTFVHSAEPINDMSSTLMASTLPTETLIDTTEESFISTMDPETTVATEMESTIVVSTSPTSEPSMEPTINNEVISSTDIISETMETSTTTDFDDEQCFVSDTIFAVFFSFDQIKRKCDICLYEEAKTRRQDRRCEIIEDLIDGFVNDYGECMLNVCDYNCTVGELQLNPKFTAGEDECRRGCNMFECGPQAANAYRYSINALMIVLMVAFL